MKRSTAKPRTPNLYVSGIAWDRESVLGLLPHINCSPSNGCARCCKLLIILVQDYEADRIAAYLGITGAEMRARLLPYGDHWTMPAPCPFRGAGECSIWPVRPVVCKYYPLQRVESEGNTVVGVFTGLCRAGVPCIAQLEKWQRGVR